MHLHICIDFVLLVRIISSLKYMDADTALSPLNTMLHVSEP